VQTYVAGFLGVIYEYRGGKGWHCSMRICDFEAHKYENIENHVSNDHAQDHIYATLYRTLEGFWSGIIMETNRL
jgi:hypothetical protein